MTALLAILLSFPLFAWDKNLEKKIEALDREFSGEIGIVVKEMPSGKVFEHNASHPWYLSSTMKVFVALSVLLEVEAGKFNLGKKLTLKESDFVDGAGSVIWTKPGATFAVGELLKKMLVESDNTATDLLIGLIGVETLDRNFRRWNPGAGKATSLLDVRYHIYEELHPRAGELSNMDFVRLKNFPPDNRPGEFAKVLGLRRSDLKFQTLAEAQENYYKKKYNSAPLRGFVETLEKLLLGKILSEEHSALILDHMLKMKTGEKRLKAGFSPKRAFYQKTGTQLNRACNLGLLAVDRKARPKYSIAVCLKKDSEEVDSDAVFRKIGKILEEELFSR